LPSQQQQQQQPPATLTPPTDHFRQRFLGLQPTKIQCVRDHVYDVDYGHVHVHDDVHDARRGHGVLLLLLCLFDVLDFHLAAAAAAAIDDVGVGVRVDTRILPMPISHPVSMSMLMSLRFFSQLPWGRYVPTRTT